MRRRLQRGAQRRRYAERSAALACVGWPARRARRLARSADTERAAAQRDLAWVSDGLAVDPRCSSAGSGACERFRAFIAASCATQRLSLAVGVQGRVDLRRRTGRVRAGACVAGRRLAGRPAPARSSPSDRRSPALRRSRASQTTASERFRGKVQRASRCCGDAGRAKALAARGSTPRSTSPTSASSGAATRSSRCSTAAVHARPADGLRRSGPRNGAVPGTSWASGPPCERM